MKTIGLLGGTGWSSTILYYTLLNQLVHEKLGDHHSAKILLKSIDYQDLWNSYGNDQKASLLLASELSDLIALKPDCIIICCNTLHKYYDMIAEKLNCPIPVMHAVDLVARKAQESHYKKVLLLATQFTMEDGFFAKKLQKAGIQVVIPNKEERNALQKIHNEIMTNQITPRAKEFCRTLIAKNGDLDALVLGCTEYSLIIDKSISILPILDPVQLQTSLAVDFAL